MNIVTGTIASAAMTAALLVGTTPTYALPLINQGITYALEMGANTNGGLTQQFALVITGENSITDPLGGRTGIHAIALNDFGSGNAASGVMEATLLNGAIKLAPTGFTFQTGGLNSNGCDGSGNFFCFQAPTSPPGSLLSGKIVMVFDVTKAAGGNWTGFATSQPHFKIDWTGSQNNYDLVSAEIGVSTSCPDCTITPVIVDTPEPASMALLALGLVGLGAVVRRRA